MGDRDITQVRTLLREECCRCPRHRHCDKGKPVLAACVVSPDDRSPSQRGDVGRNKTSGSTADPAAKAKQDKSMPVKREQSEDV